MIEREREKWQTHPNLRENVARKPRTKLRLSLAVQIAPKGDEESQDLTLFEIEGLAEINH